MSQADWIKLIIGAVLTTGLTLAGQLFIVRYQHWQMLELDRITRERDKEQVQWDVLLPRINALKDTTGYFSAHLSGRGVVQNEKELSERFRELDTFVGQFAEYPPLQRAIMDLLNTVAAMLRWQGLYPEPGEPWKLFRKPVAPTPEDREQREAIKTVELPQHYQALLTEANAVLETKRPEAKVAPVSTVWWRRFFGRIRR